MSWPRSENKVRPSSPRCYIICLPVASPEPRLHHSGLKAGQVLKAPPVIRNQFKVSQYGIFFFRWWRSVALFLENEVCSVERSEGQALMLTGCRWLTSSRQLEASQTWFSSVNVEMCLFSCRLWFVVLPAGTRAVGGCNLQQEWRSLILPLNFIWRCLDVGGLLQSEV